MADVERNIYFYKVEMADGDEWKRADVLRGLQALRGDDQLMAPTRGQSLTTSRAPASPGGCAFPPPAPRTRGWR